MAQFKPEYGGGRYAYRSPRSVYGQDAGRNQGNRRQEHGRGHGDHGAFDQYGPAYTHGGGFSYGDPYKAYGFDAHYGPRSAPRGHTHTGYRQSGHHDDSAIDYRRGRDHHHQMGPRTAAEYHGHGRDHYNAMGPRTAEYHHGHGHGGGPAYQTMPRMMRSHSAGSLMSMIDRAVGKCEGNAQCGDCCDCDCDGPRKRDCNPCEASRCDAPGYNVQRKVGWQEFEGAVARSFDRAVREAVREIGPPQPPPPQEKIMIVKQAPKAQPQPQIRIIQSGQTAGYGYKSVFQQQPIIRQINRAGPAVISQGHVNLSAQMQGLSLGPQTVQLPAQPIRSAGYAQQVTLPQQQRIVSQQPVIASQHVSLGSQQPQFRVASGAPVQQVQSQQQVIYSSSSRQPTAYTYAQSPAGGSHASYMKQGFAKLY